MVDEPAILAAAAEPKKWQARAGALVGRPWSIRRCPGWAWPLRKRRMSIDQATCLLDVFSPRH